MMKKIAMCLLHSFYLVLSTATAVLLVVQAAGRSAWPALGVTGASCLAGYAAACFLKERRGIAALAAAVLAAGCSAMLLPYGRWNFLLAVLNGALVIVGARYDIKDPETSLIDARIFCAGAVAEMVVYLIALVNRMEALKPVVGLVGYAHLMLSLLLINRRSVRLHAGAQARRMMRGNQALTWGFMIVLTLVVFFEPLGRAVGEGLRTLVAGFFNLFASKGSVSTQTDGGGMAQDMDLSALGGDNTQWPPWLQAIGTVVIYVVTAAALIALAGFIGWSLWKALRALAAWLRRWMQRFNSSGSEEYVEESEQLLSAQSMRKQMVEELNRRVRRILTRPPRWGELTPVQRVRQVYAHLLQQQVRVRPDASALTPQELMVRGGRDEAFAALYDRVRYGEGEVTEQEAEAWRGYWKP